MGLSQGRTVTCGSQFRNGHKHLLASVLEDIAQVSGNISWFLLESLFGGNLYVHVPQYQNQGCLVRGCYRAVLEVQIAFS